MDNNGYYLLDLHPLEKRHIRVIIRCSVLAGTICWIMFIAFYFAHKEMINGKIPFEDNLMQFLRYYLMIIIYVPVLALSFLLYCANAVDLIESKFIASFIFVSIIIYITSCIITIICHEYLDIDIQNNLFSYIIICKIILIIIFLLLYAIKIKNYIISNTLISIIFSSYINILLIVVLFQFILISANCGYRCGVIADLKNATVASYAYFSDNPGKVVNLQTLKQNWFIGSRYVQLEILDGRQTSLHIKAHIEDFSQELMILDGKEIIKSHYLRPPPMGDLISSVIPFDLAIIRYG
ncbi:MAG: hypothetical protein HZB23_01835 [Deltaproteobacteria bacterium]|nr:hypothetical protein [Deltaproteobacteria bacterium]